MTFQRLMDIVQRPHHPYTVDYLDDRVIQSNSWEDHLHCLREVLGGLCNEGLMVNPKNAIWD